MLVVNLAYSKDTKVCKNRDHTAHRCSTCNGGGVVFLHSHLKEVIGKLSGKPACSDRVHQVTVKDDDGGFAFNAAVSLSHI